MIPERSENDHEWVEITLLDTRLRANKSGELERYMKTDRWKSINNKPNHSQGYNVVFVSKKQIMRGRILAYVFLNIDIYLLF